MSKYPGCGPIALFTSALPFASLRGVLALSLQFLNHATVFEPCGGSQMAFAVITEIARGLTQQQHAGTLPSLHVPSQLPRPFSSALTLATVPIDGLATGFRRCLPCSPPPLPLPRNRVRVSVFLICFCRHHGAANQARHLLLAAALGASVLLSASFGLLALLSQRWCNRVRGNANRCRVGTARAAAFEVPRLAVFLTALVWLLCGVSVHVSVQWNYAPSDNERSATGYSGIRVRAHCRASVCRACSLLP